jgi:hypothetical protein
LGALTVEHCSTSAGRAATKYQVKIRSRLNFVQEIVSGSAIIFAGTPAIQTLARARVQVQSPTVLELSKMIRTVFVRSALAAALVSPIACTSEVPLAPTPPTTTSSSGAAAGTLKVTGPNAVNPVSGQTLATLTPTLEFQRAAGQFGTPEVSYEVQVTSLDGTAVYSRTMTGGAATGQGTMTHVVQSALGSRASYRWRVRAVSGADAGPWSSAASGSAMFVTTQLTASSSNDDFKNFFFSLIDQKGLGPIASANSLRIMEPDLVAVGIILQKSGAGEIRGRLYLPTGNPSNLFGRSVDTGNFGGPWQWLPRGSTTCEGLCP